MPTKKSRENIVEDLEIVAEYIKEALPKVYNISQPHIKNVQTGGCFRSSIPIGYFGSDLRKLDQTRAKNYIYRQVWALIDEISERLDSTHATEFSTIEPFDDCKQCDPDVPKGILRLNFNGLNLTLLSTIWPNTLQSCISLIAYVIPINNSKEGN
jgi:hypothetical protein